MPSVFTSLDSKVSRPLTSRQELENWIRHNKELAGLTDAYRKGLAVSKQLASKTKMMSPALCVAAQLDGKGRQLENVVAEVNSLALDYDDIPEEKMQEVFKRIKLAANTTASWITMSGHGRRIIVSYVFESHRHNEYVSTFGYLCVRYGINLQEAFDYADSHFSAEYPDTMSVMKSCYHHKERLGTWHFFRKGESYKGQSSIKMVKQWILSRYQAQRNLVTGRHQITSRLVDKPKYLSWVNLDDDILNSLWLEMEEDGLHFSLPKLFSLIHSDFAEKCDPLKEYLQNLPNWDGFDYIGELADRIHIIPEKGYYHDQSTFRKYLRKWIVAMVVGWIRPDSVNQMMLILVGKGGIFKTTFFNYLLPPSLSTSRQPSIPTRTTWSRLLARLCSAWMSLTAPSAETSMPSRATSRSSSSPSAVLTTDSAAT